MKAVRELVEEHDASLVALRILEKERNGIA